tara:strand:+ start:1290 stop:1817 length:528 start_codon:yes stop_codon:yes gene_type:complete
MSIVSFIGEKSVDLVAAIAILLLGMVFGRFISKLLQRILQELELNRLIKDNFNSRFPMEQIASSVVKYVIYFVSIVLALNQLGLTQAIVYVVLVFILILLVVFIFIAIKNFVPNMLAGSTLMKNDIIKEGDKIDVAGIKGKIVRITLTETKVETKEKDLIWIPNGFLVKHIVRKK